MRKFIQDIVRLRRLKKIDIERSTEIELIEELWVNLEKKKISKYDGLLNTCLYIALTNRDIYYLAEYHYFQKNKTRKNFFGRFLSMSIIEFLDDINHLLGKQLREELEKNNLNRFIKDINGLNKNYSSIKKEYKTKLKEIRNNASAHKNKDAKYLVNFHRDLSLDNLTEIGYNMGKLENQFVKITNQIFIAVSEQLSESRLKENSN